MKSKKKCKKSLHCKTPSEKIVQMEFMLPAIYSLVLFILTADPKSTF